MPFQHHGLLGALTWVPKRNVFVSYHHGGDQVYFEKFTRVFAESLEVFQDTSLERAYNSDDTNYIRWAIRQNNITGSSCSIVLCGARTHERKYVDWEIKATLDKAHGLIGVWLPTLPLIGNGTMKPNRLQDNIDSGYAKWLRWDELTPYQLSVTIEAAVNERQSLIRNDRPMRQRNG